METPSYHRDHAEECLVMIGFSRSLGQELPSEALVRQFGPR
jgi:hypothetical protein